MKAGGRKLVHGRAAAWPSLVLAGLLVGCGSSAGEPAGSGGGRDQAAPAANLAQLMAGLASIQATAAAGDAPAAQGAALRLYLDVYEPLEGVYGPGGALASPGLSQLVLQVEAAFHELMRADPKAARIEALAAGLRGQVERLQELASAPPSPLRRSGSVLETDAGWARLGGGARTAEIAALLEEFTLAEAAYSRGDARRALAAVERAYLEGFEPLEARLPARRVGRIERLIHLRLRPQLAGGAAAAQVQSTFASLKSELLEADALLSEGASFWFGAVNAWIIIVREGLEAVLLVAALLAYLAAAGADRRHERQIYGGVLLGVTASFATWLAARSFLSLGGASRELLEGITALLAVAVLLYVSHWLFQKTYIQDWKDYLRQRLGKAVSTGSALAMAGLAFAAVYREGFETVLFYQALLFETGPAAVLAGFVPGFVLIVGLGAGIIRLGLRLPLRRVFAVTNAILLYLAFVFLGKGIYNLQEAGITAPHPLPGAPDHPLLRQLLGVFPLADTMIAQALFLLLLLAAAIFYRWRRREVRGKGALFASAATNFSRGATELP
ncbi:MAG: FTR1 family protein [Gemmatimonadetes bacterium]|nr:FTR1 family protein [Gemmatimonadota bacterium]